MKLMDKATATFCKVRDEVSPADYPMAWRKLFSIPFALYAVHEAEEIVAMLIRYDGGDEQELGRAVANSLAEVRDLARPDG